MESAKIKREAIHKLTLGAILTALVIVLQFLGSFIHLGPFSISLVLLPIVLGAALCGSKVSTWLGLVFGGIVLVTDAAAFLAINVTGTVVTVLLKGALCGLAAGLMYKLLLNKNKYAAVVASALVCPIVNTGIFLLGCKLFFFETISGWSLAEGYASAVEYMFLGLAGGNFLVELAINIVLCPIIIRLLDIKKKL